MAARHDLPGLLHLWTAGISLASVALIATAWWPFPPPYDRRALGRPGAQGEFRRGRHPGQGALAAGAATIQAAEPKAGSAS